MHLSSMPGLQKSDADLVEEFKLIFEVCNFQFVFEINFDVSMSVKCAQVFPDIVVPHMQMYDTDCSETIEEEELIEGLGEAGKTFSPQAEDCLTDSWLVSNITIQDGQRLMLWQFSAR